MKAISGGVLAAKGFMAASTAAGIKYKDREDMALLYSQTPCRLAACFTKNLVKAAPVRWDQAVLASGAEVHAVVVNAGIANACTGAEGWQYCQETAETAAACFGSSFAPETVLLASTGVIGMQLPIDRIKSGVSDMLPKLSDSPQTDAQVARAIMTTDTRPKQFALEFELGGKCVRIGGMCKGSGMIHPNMCTMLAFITTDCAISQEMLQKALSADVELSYNMVSVDGDTSTNDTVLLLSNGLAGNPCITAEGEDYERFVNALHQVNEFLSKRIAEDGEGATHLLEVRVEGAEDRETAAALAKSVVGSSLVKAAVYGRDANWGRVLCALGYAGVPFDPEHCSLYFVNDVGKICVYKDGVPQPFDEDYAREILGHAEVCVLVCLTAGVAAATAWGCDLTHEYVSINADYRS